MKRIVTISKQEPYPQPPMPVIMRMQDMAAEATPITTGEVSLVHTDNALFELTKQAVSGPERQPLHVHSRRPFCISGRRP